MARPAVTKGDVERAVKGALAAGLPLGTFEVRVARGEVRILPCAPVEVKVEADANPFDVYLPAA